MGLGHGLADSLSASDQRLRVLAPVGYPSSFNGPRASRHVIDRQRFVPFNWINYRIEGITAFSQLAVA